MCTSATNHRFKWMPMDLGYLCYFIFERKGHTFPFFYRKGFSSGVKSLNKYCKFQLFIVNFLLEEIVALRRTWRCWRWFVVSVLLLRSTSKTIFLGICPLLFASPLVTENVLFNKIINLVSVAIHCGQLSLYTSLCHSFLRF